MKTSPNHAKIYVESREKTSEVSVTQVIPLANHFQPECVRVSSSCVKEKNFRIKLLRYTGYATV